MKKFIYFILLASLAFTLTGCTTNNSSVAGTSTENMNTSNPSPTTKEELKIETLAEGSGSVTKNGDKITVNYLGKLQDGTQFDSSYDRGTPFTFTLGTGSVITGWDVGLLGMKVGEKRKLTIPSDLGYGDDGYGPIPGKATLIFEVELLSVE